MREREREKGNRKDPTRERDSPHGNASVDLLIIKAVELDLNTPFQIWIVVYEDVQSLRLVIDESWFEGNLLLISTHYVPPSDWYCPLDLPGLAMGVPLNITVSL